MINEQKLIQLAKEHCFAYHGITPEIQNHLEINQIPQIETTNILSRYGYNDYLTQCITLLSGTAKTEDTIAGKIKKTFGYEINHGIFILSEDTITEKEIDLMARVFPQAHMIEKPEAYILRLIPERDSIRNVKLAQLICEMQSTDLKIQERINKSKGYYHYVKNFYLPLAREIAPEMSNELAKCLTLYSKRKNSN